MKRHRENSDETFQIIFKICEFTAYQAGLDLTMPRLAAWQTMRPTLPSENVEEYFRRSVLIPYLDSIIASLEIRLNLLEEIYLFPAINKVMQIALSLPAATCTIERSFTTMRRAKTWFRSTMSNCRLSGLCMLSVHREKLQPQKSKVEFIEKVIDSLWYDCLPSGHVWLVADYCQLGALISLPQDWALTSRDRDIVCICVGKETTPRAYRLRASCGLKVGVHRSRGSARVYMGGTRCAERDKNVSGQSAFWPTGSP
ncbi:hypothetical protein PR048_015724 [Dryococelus australis]|uniref:HAT C-terminal dimerisation domain-containing protein n=1 Tax=Dryococelus australis TaxID=614101 RepID=A0ABQ9HI10_9NEOP|nr:hypothetical protein PR048_015724 [Dryococelus australis]